MLPASQAHYCRLNVFVMNTAICPACWGFAGSSSSRRNRRSRFRRPAARSSRRRSRWEVESLHDDPTTEGRPSAVGNAGRRPAVTISLRLKCPQAAPAKASLEAEGLDYEHRHLPSGVGVGGAVVVAAAAARDVLVRELLDPGSERRGAGHVGKVPFAGRRNVARAVFCLDRKSVV